MMIIQLLIAMVVVNYISMDTSFSKFATIYGEVTLRPGKSAGEVIRTESSVSCALSCDSDSATCSMASYNTSSGECVLYHWTAVGNLSIPRNSSEVNGTKLFIRKDNSHIVVAELGIRYNISFPEAPDFCARVGGTVSSSAELEAARDLGWDFCDCGWLDSGKAYFWMFTASSRCGTTSLHQCYVGGRTTFNVHCTIAT